jgi:nitrogen fixation NifU-like protein
MSVADLYRQTVLDHHRAPRCFGALDGHTHAADGANPLCGDALRFEARVAGGRIEALRFRGEACAIATAAASMLGELAVGRDGGGIAALRGRFEAFLRAPDAAAEDVALGDLNALAELRRYPARHKCALLPFATVEAVLAGATAATTE